MKSTSGLNPAFGVLDFVAWDHPWNNAHYNDAALDQGLALMKEAGVGSLRADFLWQDIEPKEGTFVWEKYDRLTDRVLRQGIELLGVLQYSPDWHRPSTDGSGWKQAPDPTAYCRYVSEVVSRYKGRVAYWEVWNEPDHPFYWQPQDGMRAYSHLLTQAYAAIKKADPDAQVLMGGLSQALPKSLQQIYELTKDPVSGRFPFDIVNIHPFISPLMPDAVGGLEYFYQMVRKTITAFGDGHKPIWVTEIGCPGVPKAPTTGAIKDWWLGKNPLEVHQAEWVRQAFNLLFTKCPGVERVFWAFFRDTAAHFNDGVDYFGLVRTDFSKKPSFEAFKEIARR